MLYTFCETVHTQQHVTFCYKVHGFCNKVFESGVEFSHDSLMSKVLPDEAVINRNISKPGQYPWNWEIIKLNSSHQLFITSASRCTSQRYVCAH